MSVLFFMIPAAFVLAGFAIWAFVKSAGSGQFDDLDTPPIRAVFDDEDDGPGGGV
ncbi:MAG: cbb3-type cytochrome oxidase assembly protein CcoS [Planctomycetota bacterium]